MYLSLKLQYFSNNKTEVQIIDSTFIANKYGRNTIARNIFFKNKNCNKISFLTDSKGVPLSVLVNTGNVHDNKFIDDHINDIFVINKKYNTKNILLADKAYEGRDIRSSLKLQNYKLVIPPKKNCKKRYPFNKKLYRKRIRVEHAFQKIKAFRRIQIRYDSNIDTFLGFIYLATSFLIFNNL
jgi:transposase